MGIRVKNKKPMDIGLRKVFPKLEMLKNVVQTKQNAV